MSSRETARWNNKIGDWSNGMIGVSKTFGGSSILSSPALASAEKLGKSSLSAFFVLRNLRKRPPKDHYILERKSIFNIFFLSSCDCGIIEPN